MKEQAVVNNPIQQQNIPTSPEPKRQTFLTSKLFLMTLVILILFTIIYAGIYLNLNTQLDKITKSNQAPTIISQPSPTPDPTANWKTYTNTKHGYRVKYPPTWIAKENKLTNVTFSSPDTNESDHFGEVGIIIDEGTNPVYTEKEADEAFQKMNELLKTQSETEDVYKLEKKITVGDLPAFETTGGCCLDVGRHVFIFKENNIYRITLFGALTSLPLKNQEVFDQILSTFKFTNPEDQVVCTQDAKMCPDGSYVSRQPPNCEFAKCP